MKQKLVTDTTLSKYKVTRGYLERYIKTELKKDDILMKDLSPSFVENLFIYLLRYMTNNTAVQKMKQVKSVMKFAVEEGYIRVSPFKIVLKKEKKEIIPLTIEEVNTIRKKKLDIARLSKIRDLFVFECYTGLAFSDLASLTDKDFHVDESGNKWIIKKRHKTNVVVFLQYLQCNRE